MLINNDEDFKFTFEDKTELLVPKNSIIEISPSFYFKNINNNENNEVLMPKYIGNSDLDNFIKLFQKYISRLRQFNFDESFISIKILLEGYPTNISKLIEISEYFENNSFSIILIKDCILTEAKHNNENMNYNHVMNIDNVIILLYLSYNKLKEINNHERTNILNKNNINNIEEELESTWLDLFIKALDMIGKNLNYYFENLNENNHTSNKLWNFDKKIIDELYEKYAFNLISKNYIINVNDEIELDSNSCLNYIDIKDLNKIINFLIKKRNQNDFFNLLSNEFMKIISEENINEINSLPNPTFILKININDINNYYEEYPISNSLNITEKIKLIIVVYYKKNEDTFNVALKLSKDKNDKNNVSFDIITFLTLAYIEEIEVDNRQINVKSLSYNKSMYEIFKITNFTKIVTSSKEPSQKNEYLTLKLFLKPCYIYTLLTNYLFYNLENLCNNKNISKLSKNLLNIILQKKQLVKNEDISSSNEKEEKNNNTDKIVSFVLNWLNDEINIGEDISEIIKNIKWENASLPLVFEFLMKYSVNIVSDDIEYIFSKSLSRFLNKFEGNINAISQEIIHTIILSSKKINYLSMFCENKKIKKFNQYEIMNQKRNIVNNSIDKNTDKNNKTETDINNNENNTISNSNNININSNINNLNISSNNTNNNNIGNYFIEKINKKKINNNEEGKNKSINKSNINSNKDNDNIVNKKTKIKLGNNNSKDNKLNNNKNKNNISFINNSDICYNNYFTNCNNNFNINIKLNDKIKKIISDNNKKKVIISQIKIRQINKSQNSNNIQYIKKTNNTPNKKFLPNNSFNTPKIKIRVDKFNSNNYLNKTINFQNLKNFDKLLMKNKCEKNRKKNKSNKNIYNYSDIKNKTYVQEGNSSYNFKKYCKIKNYKINDTVENKKEKKKKHISLLNELIKMNKKGKNQNIIALKKNLNNNQSLKMNKQNLTQINIHKDNI